MRVLIGIVIHSSATKPSMDCDVRWIKRIHVDQNGWSDVGYHFYIRRNGVVQKGRPMSRNGAHTRGHNRGTVGICYEGGLSEDNKPEDNRTELQKESLISLIASLCAEYETIKWIKGHRDFSPDLNGNGIIERHEWMKACPCFDASEEYNGLENC